jgi:signal transduction histidine kinase
VDALHHLWQRRPKLTPTIRLALSYLAILMVVSLTLTVSLYRVSVGAGDRGLRRERLYFEGANPYAIDPNYQQIEIGQVQGLHTGLRNNLIGVNLLVLVVGGGLSYYLARRTLAPIEAALASQSRFAADASHELRTPLTAMKSEIEVALRDTKLGPKEARALLSSSLEEVAKLEALAGGLLRLARHEDEPLPLESVELSLVVDAALNRLATAAQQRQVKVVPGDISARVEGDLESLTELVTFLLDNAIKYSNPKSEVVIRSSSHGHTVDLSIRDTGAGINAADLPHIFERFYRADASRSKATPGYGLGLSIAARIAELHGGSIDATSKLGTGSTFTVHLSAADA